MFFPSFNNFITTEFNTISKQIPTSGYDMFISICYSTVQSTNQSTSLLYSTVQPAVSALVCRAQDVQDTKQLWIHFWTSVFIQHRNVNICLKTGHIMYSRTACSISLMPLTLYFMLSIQRLFIAADHTHSANTG